MNEKIKFEAGVTISRQSSTLSKDLIVVSISDKAAGIRQMVSVEMSLEDFARAATGIAEQPGRGRARQLEGCGRKQETKNFHFEMPPGSASTYGDGRKKIAREAIRETCPHGWKPDLSFNSQNTFWKQDGKQWARTVIRRWVKNPKETADERPDES